jgi:GntR family transcriptional regulator
MSKRYENVKSVIRARIRSGEYAPGSRIPTSNRLISEFKVSSITVRRALRDLEIEGLLSGQQGVGVFVSNRARINRPMNPPFIKSLGDHMLLAGVEPGLRELSFTLLVPDAEVLEVLKLPEESVVYRHEKVVLADNRPIGLDVTFLPRAVGEVLRQDLGSDFVMPSLERNRIAYSTIWYRLEACSLTEQQEATLESPIGTPMLSIKYAPIDIDGQPVLLGHMVTRAEWFSFDFCVDHPGGQSADTVGQSIFEN